MLIMKLQGYNAINYMDDIIGFGTVLTAQNYFDALKNLLQNLGLDISIKNEFNEPQKLLV